MNIHPKRLTWILQRIVILVVAFSILSIVVSAVERKRNSDATSLEIKIKGDENKHLLRPQDIKTAIFKKFGFYIEGRALSQIPIGDLEQALERDPFILNADVYIDANNKAHIDIEERQPILRVIGSEDSGYYLDNQGKRIPWSPHFSPRTIVVTGFLPVFYENFLNADRKNKNALRGVFRLVQTLQKDEFWRADIEQIHVQESGEVLISPKLGDHKIEFGDPEEEVEDKLKRLKAFYQEGLSREGWEKYKLISLKYKNQIVATKQ